MRAVDPSTDGTGRTVAPDLPTDRLVDRRGFLARFAAVTALASAGGGLLPAVTALPAAAQPGSAAPGRGRPYRFPESAWAVPRPEALADPTELTIAEAAYLIRARRLSPTALLTAYLERIERFDGTYQAWNTVRRDEVLAEARALPPRPRNHPLTGIPLAIKDNYFTAGTLTTANSLLFTDFVPPFDAPAVARLTGAGGLVLGKTQMGPLATTRATTPDGRVTTVNAWSPENPQTDPGGSSTGSATATAGRCATSSIGTQTGGSITGPSNAQGLTGLKPTMGRVPLSGIIPLSYTRDHPGPLARDARDAAIMLQTMAGPDRSDPRSEGLPDLPDLVAAAAPVRRGNRVELRWPTRIGVLPDYRAGTSATAVARRAFLDTIAGVPGTTVVDVPFPDDWALLTGGAFNNVRLPERTEPFAPQLREDLRGFGVSLLGWVQGLFLSGDEFLKGQRAKVLLLERILGQVFSACDVVVQTGPVPFDIVGLPEIAFPIGFTAPATGPALPLGTIVGGLPYAEDRLLSVVGAYQAVSDHHLRRPADPVAPAAAARRAAPTLRLTPEEALAASE